MIAFKKPQLIDLHPELRPKWWLPRRPTVRILVVVDYGISISSTDDFGVSKVLDIVRKAGDFATDTEFSFVRFEIETASRGPVTRAGTPDIVDIDFAAVDAQGQSILNRYDQIWLFGFSPGNSGSASDAAILADALKLSVPELAAITRWMNERKGGVLAMGDHHFLGASLAYQIPRVRSMRRWTNAQAVPPINFPIQTGAGPVRQRHDTNQPQNALQATPFSGAPGAVIPFDAQADAIPQPLEVRRFPRFLRRRYGFELVSRPHPLLCDQVYGVIDVFPDHPHEGSVFEDDEVDLGATYAFGSVSGSEYPPAVDGGSRPAPQAIAHANPWTEPPYQHFKSPTSVSRFAVLGAYDGHRANVGRVVVDSTWHHWFDVNLDDLHEKGTAAGATAAQVANWHKIKTFFRNCAVWLSPPEDQVRMLQFAAFWSTGTSLAVEDYDGGAPSWSVGETARDILGQLVSPCTLSSWLIRFIPRELVELPPREPCLICPQLDDLEQVVLGGLVREMIGERERLNQIYRRGEEPTLNVRALDLALEVGAERGLDELGARWEKERQEAAQGEARFRGALEACRRGKRSAD